MKSIRLMLAGASLLLLCSCGAQVQKETQVANANESKENAVIETIMSRRSIRQYKPQAVNRDTMQIILDCGINEMCIRDRQEPVAWYRFYALLCQH